MISSISIPLSDYNTSDAIEITANVTDNILVDSAVSKVVRRYLSYKRFLTFVRFQRFFSSLDFNDLLYARLRYRIFYGRDLLVSSFNGRFRKMKESTDFSINKFLSTLM